MADMERDLRNMMQRTADGVHHVPRPSRELVRRARLRRARTALLAGSAVVALSIGGFAGASSLLSDHAVPPVNPDPNESVVDFPNLTSTFVSPTNGFSVKHPDRAVLTPAKAKHDWDGGDEHADEGVDVVETGLAAVFKGASTEVPEESPIDEWVDGITPGGCGSTRSQQAKITIDGRSAWIAECPGEIDANVAAGDRIYLFTLLHDRSDARAVFDAFAATIDLTPWTAVDLVDPPWGVALRRMMKATFVSPTNGYSFKYVDRGGLEPAKELWDPANQPSPIDGLGGAGAEYLDEFDVVETGYGAFFMSASTDIPDGVSVDKWVDEAVVKYLPVGCYGRRSRQAPITIDGEPGRISEDCPEEIVATVVMDGRLYLFMFGHSGAEPPDEVRAVFDAWVDSIDLTPETAAAP